MQDERGTAKCCLLGTAMAFTQSSSGVLKPAQDQASQNSSIGGRRTLQTLSMSKKLLTVDFPCSSGWPYIHPHVGNTNLMGYKKKILSLERDMLG